MIGNDYLLALALWFITLAVLLGRAWGVGRPLAGLSLAYWLNLSLIHLVSGVLQALPWYKSPLQEASLIGFEVTGYAMFGLLVGNAVIAPLLVPPQNERTPPPAEAGPGRLAVPFIGGGLACTFVLLPLLGRVPTLAAIISGGVPLAVAGFCLLWWGHWRAGEKAKARRTLLGAAIIPVLSLGLHGFLSFGVTACLQLASFVAVFYRPRRTVVIAGLVGLFLGLSLYPVYMRVRGDIRAAVWGGAGVEERLGKISLLASEWEWFDSESRAHLDAVDQRLNQNYLLGRAVRRTSDGIVAFAEGETLGNSFLALIPRAVWPDKPQWSGSGGLVSRFTGLKFERATSVGIGHVMELYVNFGPAGVLCGFVLLGALLGVIDLVSGKHLTAGRWEAFACWYVVGLALLNVQGNFAEMTAGAVGSLLLCLFVSRALVSPAVVPARPVSQRA